ncbi:MAG: response regulator transcription factor [Methylobacteriaceae bacterium]|nr:response regulator transcription factor [Methylobacteriaceae bacterium]
MSFGLKVLVVDDDPAIRRFLRTILEAAAMKVADAASAGEALRLIAAERPEVVILDLGLPDEDGQAVIGRIKAASPAAILVLSARESAGEKVTALNAGADDYVTKPFDTDELLARIRTAARHRLQEQGVRASLRVGDIEVDLLAHEVRRDGAAVRLTPKEFALFAELAKHPGRVLTHGQLLRSVWGPAHEQDLEYLRVTVRALRRKLEVSPSRPTLIVNEPGVGYRLSASP